LPCKSFNFFQYCTLSYKGIQALPTNLVREFRNFSFPENAAGVLCGVALLARLKKFQIPIAPAGVIWYDFT
jgi:hypothetical protein